MHHFSLHTVVSTFDTGAGPGLIVWSFLSPSWRGHIQSTVKLHLKQTSNQPIHIKGTTQLVVLLDYLHARVSFGGVDNFLILIFYGCVVYRPIQCRNVFARARNQFRQITSNHFFWCLGIRQSDIFHAYLQCWKSLPRRTIYKWTESRTNWKLVNISNKVAKKHHPAGKWIYCSCYNVHCWSRPSQCTPQLCKKR